MECAMKTVIPKGITKLFRNPIENIIKYGNQVLRGVLYNNQGTHNFYEGWRIQYIIQYSVAKTIARKHDISMKQVFKKYGDSLRYTFTNSKGMEKEISLAMFRSFKRNKEFFKDWIFKLKEPVEVTYKDRNPLKAKCYICAETQNRRMFHRKRKSLIPKPYLHIEKEMIRINRRQVCLCATCFKQVANNELEYNQITKLRKLI